MMPFTLNILITSPTSPGSGEGRAGVLDRDIVHDDLGLPEIPGRRLKGVLVEAAKEVHDMLEQFSDWRNRNLLDPLELFGRGGQPDPGPFQLGDARLEGYQDLRRWIQAGLLAQHGQHYFHPESVLMAYTEQRSQTAMDPETGGPRKNTLRVSRLLRPGLRFLAGGVVQGPDGLWEEKAARSLALACGAFRRMGLSRNRGPGRVQVTIECAALGPMPGQEELEAALGVEEALRVEAPGENAP